MVGNRDRVNNYYSAAFGKIVKSLGKKEPENMEGITKRVNKNGETVYEIYSDFIAGKIIKAELKLPPSDHPEWGAQMVFTLQNKEGEKAVLQVPFDSAYGRGFMYTEPNVVLTDEIEFEPYSYFNKKKGKDSMGLNIFQYGKKLDWAFGTREKTGGMPPLNKIVFKGKETWDNTQQLVFLTKKFKGFCATVTAANTEVNEPETLPGNQQQQEQQEPQQAQQEPQQGQQEPQVDF